MEKTYKTSQVAKMAGVHYNTVINWIKNGELPAHQLPTGTYLIEESELKEFLRG